ncbi:hypothetical protein VNO78_18000 [Psophocarpus tetragonolobus]|uniref:Uncharacterized protein n=1 Tax=Psophocarpus tetragonolobus TaxID=3891 RepID=A0AAN9XLL3_PSOTE
MISILAHSSSQQQPLYENMVRKNVVAAHANNTFITSYILPQISILAHSSSQKQPMYENTVRKNVVVAHAKNTFITSYTLMNLDVFTLN